MNTSRIGRARVGAAGAAVTAQLCEYVVEAGYEAVPDDVRELAKLCVLDSVACMVGGSTLAPSRIASDLFAEMGGVPEATIFGTDRRLPVLHAAYLNSASANALDFDDTASGHPGATVIPPALAIAEKQRSSGRQLLLAIVLGYEVGLRVVSAIQPSPERWRQVSSSATPQTFGAVTVASKLLGLTRDQTQIAFGLAGSSAPVPSIRKFGTRDGGPISWLKNNYGASSWSGVLAGQLAARDFIGPKTILDGAHGFWIMAGSDECDFDEFTTGLGDEYRIREVSFKPYSCCRYFHAAADAVRLICSEAQLDVDEIREIRVASIAHLTTFTNSRPLNPFDIEFSLPYALALTALGVPPGYVWLSSETLNDPQVAALARKVHVVVDSDAEQRFAVGRPYETTVTISTESEQFEKRIGVALGHPRNPLTPDALHTKFHALVDPVWGEARASALLEGIAQLETCEDVSALFRETA